MIVQVAQAGTLESSDCLVTVSPAPALELEWRGPSASLFAGRNRSLVETVLAEKGLDGAKIIVQDQGALEVTLRARIGTALDRARKGADR
jgi:citrate lyase subunit gamma (acyl carrier protein)